MSDVMKIAGLRELTVVERAALEEFRKHMRDVVVPEIVKKVRARQRRAAEHRAKHIPLY